MAKSAYVQARAVSSLLVVERYGNYHQLNFVDW